MKTAVTNHAVDRYRDRVDGAKGFDRESIRESIREIVADGFKAKVVRDHPTERDRRVIPFKSGESILFLSIGPNNTTFEADLAVISVLFEHELTEGRKGGFGTLEEVAPQLKDMRVEEKWPPLIVFVGGWCLFWIYLGFVGRGGWRNRSWEDWEDEDNHHADDGGD